MWPRLVMIPAIQSNLILCNSGRIILPEFRRILLENILKENPGEAYPLTQDDLAAVEKLRAERYATWEWNYGKSPVCTMLRRSRVDGCGLIEAYITVEHGLISVVAFKGDFFSAEEPEAGKKVNVVRRVLRENGTDDLSRAVLSGDREYDILGGHQAVVQTVGVLYGYGSCAELTAAGADFLGSAVTFKGDFFSAEEPEALAARFVGHTPDRAGYTAALDGVEAAHYFAGLQADELIDILCEG